MNQTKDPYFWRTHPKSPCAQPFNVAPKPNRKRNSVLVPKRRAPSAEHLAPSAEHRAPSAEHLAPSVGNSELRASNVGLRAA